MFFYNILEKKKEKNWTGFASSEPLPPPQKKKINRRKQKNYIYIPLYIHISNNFMSIKVNFLNYEIMISCNVRVSYLLMKFTNIKHSKY